MVLTVMSPDPSAARFDPSLETLDVSATRFLTGHKEESLGDGELAVTKRVLEDMYLGARVVTAEKHLSADLRSMLATSSTSARMRIEVEAGKDLSTLGPTRTKRT